MDKNKIELFKQDLNDGVSNKFDKLAAECTEEIVCSEKHKLAMRAIVYGKTETKRVWSPKMKRIIAILVAAALLLTSCGIIFRNEIREVFDEFFVKVTYDNDDTRGNTIEKIYELSYLPGGYYLEKGTITSLIANYHFTNEQGDKLYFEQRILEGSDFTVDSENGYSKIVEIEEYDIYYRDSKEFHSYIWNDGKYVFLIKSNIALDNTDLELIIKGIQ